MGQLPLFTFDLLGIRSTPHERSLRGLWRLALSILEIVAKTHLVCSSITFLTANMEKLRKLLIANRGEIAARITKTAKVNKSVIVPSGVSWNIVTMETLMSPKNLASVPLLFILRPTPLHSMSLKLIPPSSFRVEILKGTLMGGSLRRELWPFPRPLFVWTEIRYNIACTLFSSILSIASH